jgi:tetratricopeptide (TPR) repeat protein
VVPSFHWGLIVHGARNLVYRCYLHDYGSPNPVQNPQGNGGWVFTVLGGAGNVVWSNHLTRGGHDESLCKAGCSGNRWLNNVMDGGWGHGWTNIVNSRDNLVEGNVFKSVAQMVPFEKVAVQLSDSDTTVRRNVVIESRSWAIFVVSLNIGTAGNNLVYNNTIYSPGGCYFQSSSRGVRAYFNDIFANNICYRVGSEAIEMYLGNPTNRIVANSMVAVGASGKPQPDKPLYLWNRDANGEEWKPLAVAEKAYAPFARNKALDVPPEFVDEANLDLHLSAGSPLIGGGVGIVDGDWGSTVGVVDPGAFGIPSVANLTAGMAGPDAEMEGAAAAARSGDYDAALQWFQAHPTAPDAGALASALARAAEVDDEAQAGLPRIEGGGPMARFELVRQGREDPGLWTALAADPEAAVGLADRYIWWGLDRDALELLHGEHPALAADNLLAVYERAYCRDRLGYKYYAADDFKQASGMPLREISNSRPGMALVLRLALERDPLDAAAHYLLGSLLLTAGRTEAARSELQDALKLRPAFPAASAALAKIGPLPESTEAALAWLHPSGAPPAVGAKPVAAAAGGTSPADIAGKALSAAAAGDLGGAQAFFTIRNFPQKKAEDSVREAYIELRLQRLLALAAARKCPEIEQGLTNLGNDDRGLPFTFDGFGAFIKRVRFQYLLGVVEMTCDPKESRKQFEKVSKSNPELASPDFAYPYLAMTRLGAAGAEAKQTAALEAVKKALAEPKAAGRGVLLYNQGLLQLVLGKKEDAAASFRAGAEAASGGMLRYLNLDVLRTIDNPQF